MWFIVEAIASRFAARFKFSVNGSSFPYLLLLI